MKSVDNLKIAVKQLKNGERTCVGCVVRQVEKDINKLESKVEQFGKSTSDLKAVFIGEHKFEVERWDHDQETEYYESVTIPWTTQKEIFKDMCEYVKNRKDEDIRR